MSQNHSVRQPDAVDAHDVAALPDWRRALWHDISLAARARNAFDNDDFDTKGDLNPCCARFAELRTWFVCLTHFQPAFKEKAKPSRTNEYVGRLHDVPKLNLKHLDQHGARLPKAVGN
jgi:hypothetical protein